MANLQDVLAQIPGLAGYQAQTQANQNASLGNLQTFGAVQSALSRLVAQQRQQQYQQELQAAGNDPQKIRAIAEKYASPDALIKMRTEGQQIGAGGLRLPDGTIISPVQKPIVEKATSIGAGGLRLPDGTIIPPVQKPSEQWSEPYKMDGAWVQKDPVTGRTRQVVARPSPGVSLSLTSPVAGIDPQTGKNVFFQQPKGGGAPQIIQGIIPPAANAFQNAGDAAKSELLNNGIKDVDRFKKLVIKDGTPDRALLSGIAMGGVPGTDSRLAYSYIYNAIEAKLRAESGAAVPDSEVIRMARRFVPSPLDNDKTVLGKVDRLREFLSGALSRIKPAGKSLDDPLGIRE